MKVELWGKFIALSTYIRKEKHDFKNNEFSVKLKNLEKGLQIKSGELEEKRLHKCSQKSMK